MRKAAAQPKDKHVAVIRPQHRAIVDQEHRAADQRRLPQRLGSQQSRLQPPHRRSLTSTAPGARSSTSSAPPTSSCSARTCRRCPPGAARARSTTAWSGSACRSTASTTPPRRPPRIGKLQEALQLYSASPSNRNLAENTARRGAPGGAHAERRHQRDPDLPRRGRPGDRHRGRRAERPACRFRGRQQRRHRRHARRPRRLRRARPARRRAEEDRRIRAGLDLHARRQRHGRDDQGRRDAVRDRAAQRQLHAVHAPTPPARPATPSTSTACRSRSAAGGNTDASGQHRRPGPAARRRRRRPCRASSTRSRAG